VLLFGGLVGHDIAARLPWVDTLYRVASPPDFCRSLPILKPILWHRKVPFQFAKLLAKIFPGYVTLCCPHVTLTE